jgi:hypothetical protein
LRRAKGRCGLSERGSRAAQEPREEQGRRDTRTFAQHSKLLSVKLSTSHADCMPYYDTQLWLGSLFRIEQSRSAVLGYGNGG